MNRCHCCRPSCAVETASCASAAPGRRSRRCGSMAWIDGFDERDRSPGRECQGDGGPPRPDRGGLRRRARLARLVRDRPRRSSATCVRRRRARSTTLGRCSRVWRPRCSSRAARHRRRATCRIACGAGRRATCLGRSSSRRRSSGAADSRSQSRTSTVTTSAIRTASGSRVTSPWTSRSSRRSSMAHADSTSGSSSSMRWAISTRAIGIGRLDSFRQGGERDPANRPSSRGTQVGVHWLRRVARGAPRRA